MKKDVYNGMGLDGQTCAVALVATDAKPNAPISKKHRRLHFISVLRGKPRH